MEYRSLGKTGVKVSALSMGTVSLGVDYGIEAPGEFGCPDEKAAISLLQTAAESGINLFDTAPAYGSAESLLGKALGTRQDCLLATKIILPTDESGSLLRGNALEKAIRQSVEKSCQNLRRDVIDLLQIHNATEETLQDAEFIGVFEGLQKEGVIRYLGASVYTEAEGLLAIKSGLDFVQAAYNLLDQRLATRVLQAAKECGTAIAARSAFLKGVLSQKAQWLPQPLLPLKRAAQYACDVFGGEWEQLPTSALRFCLSEPRVATVLIGPRTAGELKQALMAEEEGVLDENLLRQTQGLAVQDVCLLNPSNWPVI